MERRYKPDLDLDEAVHIGLTALKEKFEGIMSSKTIEIAYVDNKEKKLKIYSKDMV